MMKACLQRVHYDPKYVTPHHSAPPHTSLQARLSDTQHIYGTSQNHRLRGNIFSFIFVYIFFCGG